MRAKIKCHNDTLQVYTVTLATYPGPRGFLLILSFLFGNLQCDALIALRASKKKEKKQFASQNLPIKNKRIPWDQGIGHSSNPEILVLGSTGLTIRQ